MDMSGKGLQEPTQVDWDKLGASKFTPPPPAKDANGKYITYFGQLPSDIKEEVMETDDGSFRQYLLDPIKVVKSGSADGLELRFTRVSLKPFKNGNNAAALLLKAAGVAGKPQKTSEYDSAVKAVRGKVVPFTLDWRAYNKDTGEQIRGYDNFPNDDTRPGQKKVVLKEGDTYTDEDGNTQTVKSEVLFANAQVRFFESVKK